MIEINKTDPNKLHNDMKLNAKKKRDLMSNVNTRSTQFLDDLNSLAVPGLAGEEKALTELINELEVQSRQFQKKPVIEELIKYKQIVKRFIDKASRSTMSYTKQNGRTLINKKTGNIESGKSANMIKIIDEKMNELSLLIIHREERVLNLASRLIEIRGLLLDLKG